MQEAARREKRRLLDAQRGKCRVRLGCHLDEWCALKDHLGFSLHSQLAKFLLDSYRATTSPRTPVPAAITLLPVSPASSPVPTATTHLSVSPASSPVPTAIAHLPVSPASSTVPTAITHLSVSPASSPVPAAIAHLSVSPTSLQRLVFSCHQHGRKCDSPPTILSPPNSEDAPETPVLLWGCREGHQFHWDPRDNATDMETHFADITSNKKVQKSPSTEVDSPTEQEKVPEIPTEERLLTNTENQAETVPNQITERVPSNIVIPERLSKIDRTVSESVDEPAGTSNDVEIISESVNINKELSENIGERQQKTSRNEALNTSVLEKREEHVGNDEGLYHSAERERILYSASEDRDPIDEEPGPQRIAVAEGSSQESTSIDLTRRRPDLPHSGHGSKPQRGDLQVSESYLETITVEPKAGFYVPFRRSLCGRKGYRMKSDEREQVSSAAAQCMGMGRVADQMQGCDMETRLGADQNIETSTEICVIQDTMEEEVIDQKTSSEDLECLAAVGEQEDPHPGNEEAGELAQNPGAELALWPKLVGEPYSIRSLEQPDGQCGSHMVNRQIPCIDEELSQICRKRVRKSTPQELLMCEFDDCGKIFSKRQYLNYHQKYQHMNQRMFRCSVPDCGKTFNFKKHLKEHEKRHSDRRDFICEYCARAFRSSSNLIIHRRIHTGEKPLQCEFCGFTCRQKASLNWHMKKHNADSHYMFPCDICGQRFEKRDNLAAHRSRKHPVTQATVAPDTVLCIASSPDHVHDTDPSYQAECSDRQEMVQTSPQSVKETLYTEYIDLTESMQGTPIQAAEAAGNTEISLVIVL
ncbi:uncharacterized protein LOC135054923 [Pseudophryne corroboree]|uniref:uncharacterized protein LOC135054923 n=1 Tax=Pseudophryne corroboree TaxID=495146 RepID=UPI003081D815